MATKRGSSTNEPQPPELSADRALPILEKELAYGKKLLEDPKLPKDAHSAWELSTQHWLEKAFGREASEVRNVMNAGSSYQVLRAGTPGYDAIRLKERIQTLSGQLSRLESALGILRTQASFKPSSATVSREVTRMPATLDLFVSQTDRDEPLVGAVLALIDRALKIPSHRIRCTGHPAHQLPAGADVPDALRAEIRDCVVFLAVLTEASDASAYVMAEIGARWMSGGPLIILRGGGFTHKQVRGPLSYTHSLNLSSETNLLQLVRELAAHLGREAEPTDAYLDRLRSVVEASVAATPAAATATSGAPLDSPHVSPEQERVLDVIGVKADRGINAMAADALSEELRLPRTVMQHLLNELVQRGLLFADNWRGGYSLTEKGTAHVASKRMGGP